LFDYNLPKSFQFLYCKSILTAVNQTFDYSCHIIRRSE